MRNSLLLATFLLVCTSSCGGGRSQTAASFSTPGTSEYRALTQIIDNEKNAGHPIRSIYDLLDFIPADYRSHFTLAYETHGLQQGSREYPRVVAYGDRMVLGFTGSPLMSNGHTVEVIEFNQTARRFEFNLITEESQESGPRSLSYSTQTPPICASCHMSDSRPIWASYRTWPGFLGSLDDELMNITSTAGSTDTKRRVSADERSLIIALKNKIKFDRTGTLRYKKLDFNNQPMEPFSPYKIAASARKSGSRFRPNFILTSYLVRNNAYRLARILESSPLYGTFKYALFLLGTEELTQEFNTIGSCATSSRFADVAQAVTSKLKQLGLNPKPMDSDRFGAYFAILGALGLSPELAIMGTDAFSEEVIPNPADRAYHYNAAATPSQMESMLSVLALDDSNSGNLKSLLGMGPDPIIANGENGIYSIPEYQRGAALLPIVLLRVNPSGTVRCDDLVAKALAALASSPKN